MRHEVVVQAGPTAVATAAHVIVVSVTETDTAEMRAALVGADRVAVIGDTHGDMGWHRILVNRLAGDLGVKVLLHVGDLGIGPWPGETRDKMVARLDDDLARRDAWLLATEGNHENAKTIDAAPRDALGFAALGRNGRVRVFGRPRIVEIGGRTFASLGGAFSVDWRRRTARKSWWPERELVTADQVALLAKLVDGLAERRVDVFLSHEAPAGLDVTSRMELEPADAAIAEEQRRLVRRALEQCRPERAFAGHWHQHVEQGLRLADGTVTRCRVLNLEHHLNNAWILDLATLADINAQVGWQRWAAER